MNPEQLIEKQGAIAGLQCVVTEIGWIYNHYFELIELSRYDRDGISGVISDILRMGLSELKSYREQIEKMEQEERSEKDCLWDGCD